MALNRLGQRVRMAALLCLVPLAMPPATAQSTSGSILGDVTDLSGAFLPGATVSVSNNATGATREASTNEAGAFRFSGLPPSNYSVTVEFPGFRAVTRPSVTLAVGGATKVDFELDLGPIEESIMVTGTVPLVQPTENTIQVVVANQRVQELPTKSRDFMDLMLLSPGVTVDQSSARSGNSDSVSFYGMDERNKSVWLEGVDFNDEVTMGGSDISEATRTRLGQEAIQEFQVLSSGYSAEFGRTGSGAINVVVKSGGNDIHGSGFYFIRDDAFDKDPFQVVRGEAVPDANPPPFQTQQYGFTVGGPFVRHKVFYFGSIERRTDENSSHVTIPDSVKAFVDSLNAGYDTSSALPRSGDERNALGKFTLNLHPLHTLNIMYLYDDREFTNKQTGQANGADNGFDDVRSSYYATASLTSLIGNRIVNEFRANRSIQRLTRDLQARASGRFLPTLDFPSVDLGPAGNVPQGRVQANWIFSDTMSWERGNHSFKWGGESNRVLATADANVDFQGVYRFPSDTATLPDRYTANFNLPFENGTSTEPRFISIRRDVASYAAFVNDTWRVTPRFTINMGLRWDKRTYLDVDGVASIGGPDAFEQPGFSRDRPQDVWVSVALGELGALPVRDWRPGVEDKLDLSPRFGFSWDVTGNGHAVVRASYGVFHDRINTSTLRSRVLSYNGLLTSGTQLNASNAAQNAIIQGNFPNRIATSLLPGGASVGGTPDAPSARMNTPYTQQSHAGFQYGIKQDLAVSVDFVHILGLNYDWGSGLSTPWEPNAPLPGATSPSGRVCPFARQIVAQLGLPATAANLRSNSAGCLRIQVADFTNRLHINSLSFRLEKRFTRDFGFLAGYTLGSAKGFDWTSPHIKHGEANFGPTENDVPHRFTGNFIYRFPRGVQVSSILTANSAPPYDITTGNDDNFDFLRNDRPAGVGAWAGRGANFFRWDLRLTKKFVIAEDMRVEVMWEMYNVGNRANLVNFNGNQRSSSANQARGVVPSGQFQGQFGLRFVF